MANLAHDFDGSDGGTPGAPTGSMSGFTWDNVDAGSALLSTGWQIQGATGVTLAAGTKRAALSNGAYAGASSAIYFSIYMRLLNPPLYGFQVGSVHDPTFWFSNKCGITSDLRLWAAYAAHDYDLTTDLGSNGTTFSTAAGVVPEDGAEIRLDGMVSDTRAQLALFHGANLHTLTPSASVDTGVGSSIGSIGATYLGPARWAGGTEQSFVTNNNDIRFDRFRADTASMPAPLTAPPTAKSFAGIVPI